MAIRTNPEKLGSHSTTRRIGRLEVSVGIGNFMEWFEFAIYGYFAATIGATFFPADDPTASLLATFAVFAVGFFARPIGGLILGPIGDKYGRRQVLVISVGLMGITTAGIGLTPGYDAIGIAAPIIVLSLRILQGIAAGGEWSSASAYIIESAPNDRRARRGSLISGTAALSFLAGVLTATLVSAVSPGDTITWTWRIPFVVSFLLSLVAIYIRLKLEDTPVFEALKAREGRSLSSPKRPIPRSKAILLAITSSALFGVSLYFLVTYMSTYLQVQVGLTSLSALIICSITLVWYAAINPLAGRILDRRGRRLPLLFAAGGLAILGAPIFIALSTGVHVVVLIALLVLASLVSIVAVCNVVLLVELFPAAVRSRNSALGYNLGIAAFGGTAPFAATWLIDVTSNSVSPGFYLSAIALIAGLVIFTALPETKESDIYE